ncbi:hypothetical protein VNO77_22662 [Canavalia gladiata]|uniref:Uncharacterized protein n=1 Tax=Canavalia gladiata TaxID=3824 RepID=A0AAN9QAS5_CANGL
MGWVFVKEDVMLCLAPKEGEGQAECSMEWESTSLISLIPKGFLKLSLRTGILQYSCWKFPVSQRVWQVFSLFLSQFRSSKREGKGKDPHTSRNWIRSSPVLRLQEDWRLLEVGMVQTYRFGKEKDPAVSLQSS